MGLGNPASVAVTTLCEFAARTGDLDFRYTPSPTAIEGIRGHSRLQRQRGEHYLAEFKLEGECEGLRLSGRADGYDPVAGVLEEIKTHRGDLNRISAAQQSLHWAQLRAYGALLCEREGLSDIKLRLSYYDIGCHQETQLHEDADAGSLKQHLQDLCCVYSAWYQQQKMHKMQRDEALAELTFPFTQFRKGQRELAETVFKTIRLKKLLLLQAPTGLGKTVGTLFPSLMAMPAERIDCIFYLTARNTVRQLAFDGLKLIFEAQKGVVPLRVLELSSKDQACEHPDLACHGESCPLARGFFDRLDQARQAATEKPGILDHACIRQVALDHTICPYYLGQEMARWSDLIVTDVNRYFDQHAILYALTQQNSWCVTLLVDEGHNLIDRARNMYSTRLEQAQLLAIKRSATTELKSPLQALARQWSRLIADHGLNDSSTDGHQEFVHLQSLPANLNAAIHGAVVAITQHLSEYPADAHLQELLFDLLRYTSLAEQFADHSLCELNRYHRGKAQLAIQNLIPASFLMPRFEAAHSSILFSATLSPARYYQDLLGLSDETHWQNIASPFSAHQLKVRLLTDVSTRLRHRQASIAPIVDHITDVYRHSRGNYLVFTSSFSYLNAVSAHLREIAPDIPTWSQEPGMSAQRRGEFLERFSEEGAGIGFAVLGGAFAEGIDLPGQRLIGVVIATLGLPPFDTWHETLRQRLQARYGQGYEYAYLYPGLQKVSQAAGRLIRTPQDQGVVMLIDDRFANPEVQALLPDWWFE